MHTLSLLCRILTTPSTLKVRQRRNRIYLGLCSLVKSISFQVCDRTSKPARKMSSTCPGDAVECDWPVYIGPGKSEYLRRTFKGIDSISGALMIFFPENGEMRGYLMRLRSLLEARGVMHHDYRLAATEKVPRMRQEFAQYFHFIANQGRTCVDLPKSNTGAL